MKFRTVGFFVCFLSQGKLDTSSALAELNFGHKSGLAFCFGMVLECIFHPFCCESAVALTAEDGKAAVFKHVSWQRQDLKHEQIC